MMNEFDRWFQEYKSDREDHEWLEAFKPHLEKAWNAALDEGMRHVDYWDPLKDLKSNNFKYYE